MCSCVDECELGAELFILKFIYNVSLSHCNQRSTLRQTLCTLRIATAAMTYQHWMQASLWAPVDTMATTTALPMPSLHPRDVDQTVRRIRGLTKRATEMVCGGECGFGLFDVVSCHSPRSRFLEQLMVIHMSEFGRTACTRTPIVLRGYTLCRPLTRLLSPHSLS